MKSGAITRVMVASSFTRTWRDGPAVSLKGSPTVSPTTAAACAGVPLPSTFPSASVRWPDSMYFLALSQAPPPLFEDGCEEDAGDRADHQQTGHGLVAEQDADDDRRGDGDEARQHHLAEGGAGRDVDDSA